MQVTVAATQMACGDDRASNIDAAERLVRTAAAAGARLVLIQELFEGPYFPKRVDPAERGRATSLAENPAVTRFTALARELDIVLPVSFYEQHNTARYNSLAMIDADGTLLGIYRKAHIPDGPGYHEKFYFNGGDTGFPVWKTAVGRVGALVCWDQWFPEPARILALKGADLLLYPTAIGSEPHDTGLDSRDHWRRTMQGHAAANMVPVVASNRIGVESAGGVSLTFYGSSFVTDHLGAIVGEAGRSEEAVVTATLDLAAARRYRDEWGVFRDRRPDLYRPILSLDGETIHAGAR